MMCLPTLIFHFAYWLLMKDGETMRVKAGRSKTGVPIPAITRFMHCFRTETNIASFNSYLAGFEKKYNTENKQTTRSHFVQPLKTYISTSVLKTITTM